MQGGIKEVLKLKEENQNKSSSFGHQRNTFFFNFIFKLYIIVLVLPDIKMNPSQVYFELNEDNPMKKLYLIHQVQFPDFWVCSDYLLLKFFLVKDCLVMPNIQRKNY